MKHPLQTSPLVTLQFAILCAAHWLPQGTAQESGPSITATCVDRSGVEMDVSQLAFRYSYTYPDLGRIHTWILAETTPLPFFPVRHRSLVVRFPFISLQSITLAYESPTAPFPNEIQLTMTDGRAVSSTFWRYGDDARFVGKSEFGDFTLAVSKTKQVTIHSRASAKTTAAPCSLPPNYSSTYKVRVRTNDGTENLMEKACFFELDHDLTWKDVQTSVKLRFGESQNTVAFEKIRSLQIDNVNVWERPGQYTSTSGKTYPVKFSGFAGKFYQLGGLVEPFGACWIPVGDIAVVEIIR